MRMVTAGVVDVGVLVVGVVVVGVVVVGGVEEVLGGVGSLVVLDDELGLVVELGGVLLPPPHADTETSTIATAVATRADRPLMATPSSFLHLH